MGSHARKELQLAAQIARSVESTLLGECEDEVLQNLSVDAVEPAPGNRMLVRLLVHAPGNRLSRDEVLARLDGVRPLLTARAQADASRRALPELTFWLVRAPDDDAVPSDDEDVEPPSLLDLD